MVLVRRLPNDFFESNNFLSYLVKWLSVCLREQICTFFMPEGYTYPISNFHLNDPTWH